MIKIKKNYKSLTFIATAFLVLILAAGVDAFAGGDGSSGNPYQITNCVELQAINTNVAADYILINNIDCSETSGWNSGAGFVPIVQLAGTFDGQEHKITGLFIYRPFNIGLFRGIVSGAIVKNVGLVDVRIAGSGFPGGSNYIGGLVGNNNGGIIANSYVTGSVSGDLRIGGLTGANVGTIINSYTNASISGVYHIGGLTGANHGLVINSYSTGRVTAYYLVGGLVGYNYLGTTTNSYWDIATSGQSTSDGGTGKTTAQMKQRSTFVGWDFTNIWTIDEGVSYPYLKSQIIDVDDDGIRDLIDNCPNIANTNQLDSDGDGLGDVCDICILDPTNDIDNDAICGNIDNCQAVYNPNQADIDGDGLGDVCDSDDDNDGVLDVNDLCQFEDARGFDANIDGCIDNIAGLQQVLNALPDDVLSDEIKNSLVSKVDNALKSVDKENDEAAINILQAFINGIESQKGKKISEEAADMLITYTNNVISQIV